MNELNYLTSLYDYYKDLLTNKQRDYFEEYYFEYEKSLNLYYNKNKILSILDEESCKKISDYI